MILKKQNSFLNDNTAGLIFNENSKIEINSDLNLFRNENYKNSLNNTNITNNTVGASYAIYANINTSVNVGFADVQLASVSVLCLNRTFNSVLAI